MSGPLLTGQIAKAIYSGFKGKLLTGNLWRFTPGTGTDEWGDPLPGTWASHPLEGMIDEYDEAYRARAGIPKTDVSLLIFAQSLSVKPTNEDVVQMSHARGDWWQARGDIGTDPATAAWSLQAFAVGKPSEIS